MSLKGQYRRCNKVKSGRRWARRPWKWMGMREKYRGRKYPE